MNPSSNKRTSWHPAARRGGKPIESTRAPRAASPFEAFQGIPDSSSVVVYDPTGTVGELEGQDAYLFQDGVQSCIHLEGPWHRCWLD